MHRQPSGRYSFKGEVLVNREKSWLFRFDEHPKCGDKQNGEVWLPKSECDFHADAGDVRGSGGYVMVPEWLCRKLDILP